MVGSEREQDLVNEDNVLKVVDDALAVQKVHCGGEPVPVKALGRSQGAGAAGDVGNGNDLLEGDDLDGGDDCDHVDVAHEEGAKEDANHDKGPQRPRPKVGHFLFVLGSLFFGGGRFLESLL